MAEWLVIVAVVAQAWYWLGLRDAQSDDRTWDACLCPGGKGR